MLKIQDPNTVCRVGSSSPVDVTVLADFSDYG